MRYKIPIQEQVSIWQNIDAYIDTEDSIEEIYKHIRKGDFIFHYEVDDYGDPELMLDTERSMDYDYGNTFKTDIEEIK